MQARAAVDLSILWALNANSILTVYWMLRNIYATPGLLEEVRREIAPACSLYDDKLKLDWKSLLNDSRLFKSCYFESLRVDAAPWSFKRLQKDCTVQETPEDARKSSTKTESTTFHMQKGDVVLVPADLHRTDARYFQNPSEFDPKRFFVETDEGQIRSEIKTIRPYGGGATMCKGGFLAEREVLAFVATMLT
ncbi:cytochrome P450 [Penicillium herquei]|nr:cytochrome P450 [Penicillium herquei]